MRIVQAGSTDVSINIRIIDSTDGTPETGVEHNTAGIDLWYRREGAALTSITEVALAALTTAHTDGGIEHIDDGWYRLDVPDAAFADGVTGVQIGGTVTGMVVLAPYVELVDYDPYDGVRLGLTALPNANADAAGGLPISDGGGLDLDAILVDTNSLNDTKIPDTISLANINTQVDTALSDIHLDHLLAVDYDPASKPGIATALLNELVENDGGIARFTANALEQAPAGGGGSGDWTAGEREQIRQALGITGTKTATSGGNLDTVQAATDQLAFTGGDVNATLGAETVTVGANNDKTGYSISGTITTLDGLNDVSTAEVNAQVDQALVDIHLDHLFAVAYDPASKPGISSGLLNILVENDGGVPRYTANALEQAPSAGGGTDWSTSEREQIRQALGITGTKLATSGGNLDSVLDDTGTSGVALAADSITAAVLAADATSEIAGAVPGQGDVDGFSIEESLKLILAVLAGELSGAATATNTIRAADDSKVRVTSTVDADGNRSAVTLDATG